MVQTRTQLRHYRYVRLPIGMLNDDRLNPVDVVAWCIMCDASRAGLSTISERRLGQRLRRSEDTARRIIRKLASAGWIEIIGHGNGRCRDYRLLSNGTNARRSGVKTPGVHARGLNTTPRIDAPDPSHLCPKNPGTGAAQPRSYSDNYQERQTLEKRDGEEISLEQARQNIAKLAVMAT